MKVNPDLSTTKICDLDPDTDWFCACLGGIAVFTTKECKLLTLYNMLDGRIKYLENVDSMS